MSKTKNIQALSRRAMFDPSTVDAEKRTVEVVFATDNSVRMYGWDGPFDEILSMESSHVRWGRMEAGAPVLDNHNRYGKVSDTVLGVVERAWADGGKGRAILRFSKREDADKVFQDIQDGIIRNVSVGYRVHKYQITEAEGEVPEYRAVDWEPYEVSMVSVPADFEATVRSDAENANEVELEFLTQNKKQRAMATEKEKVEVQETETQVDSTRSVETTKTAESTVDAEKVRSEAVAAERKRSADIKAAVRMAKLGDEFAEKLIEDGTSVEKARELILEEFANNDPADGLRSGSSAEVVADETDKRRHIMTEALVMRSGKVDEKTIEKDVRNEANKYRHETLMDMAKDSLERAGVDTKGMSKMEIAKRAITTSQSDFPVLLEGTNRRVLLANFEHAPDTWREFCSVGSVGDFREHKRLRKGSFSRLDQIDENQEYKNKPIPDAEQEAVSVKTYGNTINVSRHMIVNDDLSAFTDLAAMLGRAAARSIEIDVYGLFALNSGNGPLMGDGKTLFHADHGNIATAAALSVASIDAMRVLMAKQKDPSGNDFLDIRPETLVLPIGLGSQARVINDADYDIDAIDGSNKNNKFMKPNSVRGLFKNIVDTPRLDGSAHYLFASRADQPVFEVSFLNGVQTPYMESQQGFHVDGMEWKIRLDYGVGAVGWRGIVKNAGA